MEESLPGFTGLKLALTLSMQTRDDHLPRDISWKEFSVSKGSSHKKITFDKKAFFKAMETFISIDFAPLEDLITSSFEEVQSVVGDQGLLKHYNFEALHKKAGAAHQHETPAKQLALFAIEATDEL